MVVANNRSWTKSITAQNCLVGTREQLPPRLVRSERMLADPPEVVEIWFA